MARRVQIGRVKANRAYSVEELAEVTGCTEATIRRWIKNGLRAMTNTRPALVLGSDLKDYLASRQKSRKRPLGPGQLFCLGCKVPTVPAFGEVEYTPIVKGRGLIKGFCPACECVCSRIISATAYAEYAELYRVTGNSRSCP